MGEDKKQRSHDTKESKEERLLRKAKEYIKKQKKTDESSQRKKRKRHDESDRKKKKERHNDDDNKKKRRRDDEKKRRKNDRKKESRKEKAQHQLFDLGSPIGKTPQKLLQKDDYFAYHEHLWVYLYREEGIAFNDLGSDETHKAFERFCKAYNKGRLAKAYYEERLPSAAVEECKTTKHSWDFRTSNAERQGLQALQEGIRKQTEYSGPDESKKQQLVGQTVASQLASQTQGTEVTAREDEEEMQRRTAEDRYQQRVLNRRMKSHVKNVTEELDGGPKDFKEKQREKRKETNFRMHAASRERDGAGVELNDEGIYGAQGEGEIGFQAALAREKDRKNRREEAKQARIKELQSKESEKQENMLKMLGLSDIKRGQKIKIQPRRET